MTPVLDTIEFGVGMQLPVQAQSPRFAQAWEADAGVEDLVAVAQACDRAGFLYASVCDHVVAPVDSDIGPMWYDPISTLGFLVAQTTRLRLLSHVFVAPYRHPLMAAKQWATLDHLSGGRMICGVGAGHVEGEFDALGVDFAGRGRAVERCIEVMRQAWTDDPDLGVVVRPAPAQAGGPPIWVGGSSPAAIRRAAVLGDGWLPQGPPASGMRAAVAEIHERRAEAGRDDQPFGFGVNCEPVYVGDPDFEVPEWTLRGSAERIIDRLGRYRAVGLNQLELRFPARSAGELCDQIERFGAEVLPGLSALQGSAG